VPPFLAYLAVTTVDPRKSRERDTTPAGQRTPVKSLVRYRNQADKSLHELRTAMHHHPLNQERAISLSILTVFGPGEVPRVESN